MSSDDLDVFDDEEETSEHTYLTFRVGSQDYAVPVGMVIEIVRIPTIYEVPDVPAHIRGVTNLRGKVIPLLDVRRRFALPPLDYDDRTVVVVLEYGESTTGLVVDAVSEVAEFPSEQIEHRSGRDAHRPAMVSGIGKRGVRVTFILDVPALLDVEPATGGAHATQPAA